MRRCAWLLLALPLPALALLDGAWDSGAWEGNVWTEGVWAEGETPSVTVPNVVGQSLTNADSALEGEGLDTGTVVTRCSDEDENVVLSQSPLAGASVASGTLVHLVASNGEACPLRGRPGVRLPGLRFPGL